MSNPPTLIFIPGSWHKPLCYDPLIQILQDQHGLKCTAVALPSNSENPAATFKDDLDVARDAISSETRLGRNVVVIAHSYGGMVGNSAIKGFARRDDQSEHQRDDGDSVGTATATGTDTNIHPHQPSPRKRDTGSVIGLILIASGFTFTGLTFMDPFLDHPPPAWRANRSTGFAELITPPRELFYHDLSPTEAAYWTAQLTPQSLKALFEGREHTYAGWQDVPVWYVGTTEDRGLPVLAQRVGVGMARGMGARVEHREVRTSHSPFLSQPMETGGIVVEAVRAFVEEDEEGGGGVKGRERERECRDVVTVPKAVLWRPFTWLRFGLPLVLGHVVGRGILVFSWGRRMWRSRFGLRSV
ncbi:alpha/beta-hydrolase [Aspergillus steynii IBT 23096]|uniref:Alpha/beta-hydrolase n=1 Tax=Aspergillus steynii IBT 23096 TaxID=1392250 RepID=A0A2I2GS25_9EURO|nr:alpha/beta-hydrolase [Aspergillus steynii IBT 23096]PLB55672.1 alpha/beta-hydrolase [Aspergillus steynii IBT 23096]